MFKIQFYRVECNAIAGEIALRIIVINCIYIKLHMHSVFSELL